MQRVWSPEWNLQVALQISMDQYVQQNVLLNLKRGVSIGFICFQFMTKTG